MPAPFVRLTLAEFAKVLGDFNFTRAINQVHMHHTWKPDHADFRAQGGKKTVEGMWRHHTQVNGWSDIAQHISIDPDGFIWTGRNWNQAPASASGFNGNSQKGPFMFEMIGNFDKNRDPFTDPQRATVLHVIALVQKRFKLKPESLHFHREMSTKTCPGNGIDYNQILEEVRNIHARGVLAAVAEMGAIGSTIRGADEKPELFPDEAEFVSSAVREAKRVLGESGARALGNDPGEAEPDEESDAFPALLRGGSDSAAADGLTPEVLASLRPYVINMVQGRFSDEGRFATSPDDVDAIFEQHIPAAMAASPAPLKIVFWAHGGLVSETAALQRAAIQVPWWRRNNVYPIYFVWETGLFETIGQLLRASQQRGARDIWDHTTDPMVEAIARALKGPLVWSGMKRSAERASDADGAARYTAQQLAKLLKTAGTGKKIEVHAVGHSAGAIFHSHFLPAALDEGVKSVTTASFLAPAVRTDIFQQQLAKQVGKKVEQLTLFTMRKDLERADNCKGVYRKSLLYLIHHALEPEDKAPLLGLEISLRGDPALKKLFGLDGGPDAPAEVVWSKTESEDGRSASRSTSHGGFDNDQATMNSILRRVLDVGDDDQIAEYPQEAARALDGWDDQGDWPEDLRDRLVDASRSNGAGPAREYGVSRIAAAVQATGNRRALCVGIDEYKRQPLHGCVADANMWATTLQALGFATPTMLINAQATRAAILRELSALIGASKPGDVVVFQFAGHGTTLPDVSGDEADGDTPQTDEAICSYDFTEGAFVIDDDIRAVFKNIPDGVNVTCFIDCCHSGTISRFAVGGPDTEGGADERPRVMVATEEMKQAHRRFRSMNGIPDGGRTRSSSQATMREVVFSACQSDEVAWEKDGHGEFTVRATEILRRQSGSLTHEAFLELVVTAFGSAPRQHPQLDSSNAARTGALLQGIAERAQAPGNGASADSGLVHAGNGGGRSEAVARLLRDVADLL